MFTIISVASKWKIDCLPLWKVRKSYQAIKLLHSLSPVFDFNLYETMIGHVSIFRDSYIIIHSVYLKRNLEWEKGRDIVNLKKKLKIICFG